MPIIRPAHTHEQEILHSLWERSVRATHSFLGEKDIDFYGPMVWEFLASPGIEIWVAASNGTNTPLGFMGLSRDGSEAGWKLDALFMDPAAARKGIGSQQVRHARLLKGDIVLDVNEQNPGAIAFYRSQGFTETGRSLVDGAGKPFPLIHMKG